MLSEIIRGLAFLVTPLTNIILIKNLFDFNYKIITRKNIFIVFIVAILNILLYSFEYSFVNSILLIGIITIANKFITKETLIISFIMTCLSMIVIAVADMLSSILLISHMTASFVRTNSIAMLLGNILVGMISVILSRINYIKTRFNKFIKRIDYTNTKIFSLFLAMLLVVMSVLLYMISTNYNFDFKYLLLIFVISIFFGLLFILIYEYDKYLKLRNEYNTIFEYFKGLEEWIDEERLLTHEHKNQLATIQSMTKEKKVKEYINEILKTKIDIENQQIEMLKDIPNGGMKGLIYYKIIMATRNGISINIDINKKVGKLINKLSLKEIKNLSQILGIYFDNAIEEAITTKEKLISLEIYNVNNDIKIVLSNSISGKVDINEINKKNFSKKGKNRGNGLFYVRKLINENKNFQSSSSVINNYFYQTLILCKENNDNKK